MDKPNSKCTEFKFSNKDKIRQDKNFTDPAGSCCARVAVHIIDKITKEHAKNTRNQQQYKK